MDFEHILPLIFLGLMGFSFLVYTVLDGYDLGVGILSGLVDQKDRNLMIASIGPFWDANETWLVLGVGIMLIAFPQAHGMVLTSLYLPVAIMLMALVLRGVAFDFRTKADLDYTETWDLTFRLGSLVMAASQGYMVGQYVLGLESTFVSAIFGLISAFCITAAYVHIGACWLVFKMEGDLQKRAIGWALKSLYIMLFGILLVSIVNPIISPRIFERWFSSDNIFLVIFVPLVSFGAMAYSVITLNRLKHGKNVAETIPFYCAMATITMSAIGLGYSFFPYVVPDRLTVWDAAASHEALVVIFYGAAVVVPLIALYTAFSYYVFRGKAKDLSYD